MEPRSLTRRTFLRWAALTAGVTALAACGTTAAPQAAPTEAPAEQPTSAPESGAPAAVTETVEVRFAFWDWYAMAPGVAWDEWNQSQAFPVFEEANPGVKLSWELVDDFTKVLTQMSAGTAPDVMSVWDPAMTVWAEKGQLLDLQPFVDRDIPDADDIYIGFAWEQMWNGDLSMRMGMLADLDITSVYYNKEAFEEAGVALPTTDWTTDDYKAAAMALTVKDDAGEVTRWGGELRADFWTGWSHYILAWGGQVRDPETRMTCLLDSAESMEAIEWMRKGMFEDNCFAQPNQMGASGLPSTWTGAVPAGILAFAERSADQFFSMADSMGETAWDIAHVPQGPKDRSCMGLPDQWVVYKGVIDRGNEEQVWSLMKWLVGDWYQEKIASVAGRIPGLKSIVDKWADILRTIDPRLENVSLETLTEQMEMGYPRGTQMFRFQSLAEETIGPAMEQIFVEGKADASLMQEIAPQVTEAQQKELAASQG